MCSLSKSLKKEMVERTLKKAEVHWLEDIVYQKKATFGKYSEINLSQQLQNKPSHT